MPKNIHEFMDFYGIAYTDTTATFYKAVHKCDGEYHADYNSGFTYQIGDTAENECDPNVNRSCSIGLHVAYCDWALRYGNGWSDLAILEVESDIADIVLPIGSDGKVRTSKLKVIREVPLDECGLYGKMLARRIRD